MGLRFVPRGFDVAVSHVGMCDLEALGRHEAVERGGDPLRSRIERDEKGARVGAEIGTGGDGGAGGDQNQNAECGMGNAECKGG